MTANNTIDRNDITTKKERDAKSESSALHNTLFVNDSQEREESAQNETVKIDVSEAKDVSKEEVDKIDKQLDAKLKMTDRLKEPANTMSILLVALIVVMIVVLSLVAFKPDNPPLIKVTGSQGTANLDFLDKSSYDLNKINFLPHFNIIHDTVFFRGYTWVGAIGGLIKYSDQEITFYSGFDGIDGESVTTVESAGASLWIGFQGGIARFDEEKNKFETHLTSYKNKAILNPRLFFDEISGQLFLGTLDGLYVLDEQEDKWLSFDDPVPLGVNYFAADKEGIFVVNRPNSIDGGQVYKYDRQRNSWADVSPWQIKDISSQIFTVDDQVLVLGQSSANSNVKTAVRRAENAWQTAYGLEKLDRNSWFVRGPKTEGQSYLRVPTSTDRFKIYNLSYKNGVFSYQLAEGSYRTGPIDDRPFSAIKNQIVSISNIQPKYQLFGIDSNGALIASYQTDGYSNEEKLVYITNSFDQAQEIATLQPEATFQPIFCRNQQKKIFKYAFVGKYLEHQRSWQDAALYRFDDKKLNKIADLKSVILNSRHEDQNFMCLDEKIYWNSDKNILSFDLNTTVVNVEESFEEGIFVGTNDGRGRMFFWDTAKRDSNIYIFSASVGKLIQTDLGREIHNGVSITEKVTIVNDLLWVPSLMSQIVYIFSLDGVELSSFVHDGTNGLEIFEAGPDKALVVQTLSDNLVQKRAYNIIYTNDFKSGKISYNKIPSRAELASSLGAKGIYDEKNDKVWISGIGSSVFAINID